MIHSGLRTLDPERFYTLWSKHPHRNAWVLERSYLGSYFLYDEGQFFLDSPEHLVVAKGVDPNAKPNPSLLRVGRRPLR